MSKLVRRWALLVYAIVVMCAVMIATLGVFRTVDKRTAWVRHTNLVLAALEDITATMRVEANARRAFWLTLDARYRVEYRAASATLGAQLAALRTLTIDNPSQAGRIDKMRVEFAALDASTYRSLDKAARNASKQVDLNGVRERDPIFLGIDRSLLDIRAETQRLLVGHERSSGRSLAAAKIITTGGNALAIVLLLVAFELFRRERIASNDLREKLHTQAIRDPLTGLHNRRYLDEVMSRELSRGARANQLVGVLMIDIDHFKKYNDAYGHEGGDILLRRFGAMLGENTRHEDIVCRYGGEEFCVIMLGVTKAAMISRAEHIRLSCKRIVSPIPVTASVGIAIGSSSNSQDSLLRDADRALYAAKNAGRDRVVCA